jgi:hypothetical protein
LVSRAADQSIEGDEWAPDAALFASGFIVDETPTETAGSDREQELEVLFESEVGSRRPASYVMAAFIWLLLLAPVAVNPMTLLFLPYSVPMGGLAIWLTYSILTNRTHRLSVFRDRIVWGPTSTSPPAHVLLMRDVLRLTVEQRADDPNECIITVYLKDGTEKLLPAGLIDARDREAMVRAIQQAAPGTFVRYLP